MKPAWHWAGVLLGAGWLMLLSPLLRAQQNTAGAATGVNIIRYHPAPHFRQREFQLTGERAGTVAGTTNQIYMRQPRLQAWQTNGDPIVMLEAEAASFSEPTRTLSSPEALRMRSGDGRFSLAGKGFHWQQNQKVLVISNDVRAVVQWTNNAPPVEITSRWFEFDAVRQRGVFHENVQGENVEFDFSCDQLSVGGGAGKTNRSPGPQLSRTALEVIEAEGNFVLNRKTGGGFARAHRGSYHPAEERVELQGAATWQFDPYAGQAERMVAWLATTNIEASGNVKLTLPRAGLGAAAGILSATNTPARRTDAGTVTLTAAEFNRTGPSLLAVGQVRISDGTNELHCDRLEGQQAPTEYAVATGNVFVGRATGGIYADRADYTKTNQLVMFTGSPRLEQGDLRATATRVLVRLLTSEVFAQENVTVTFPLASGGKSFLDFLPELGTNRPAASPGTNQFAQITAQQFLLRDQQALFSGEVRARQLPATGSEPRLSCGELEIRLGPESKRLESLQARIQVVCESGALGITNGPLAAAYSRLECERITARTDPRSGDLVEVLAAGGVDLRQTETRARGERLIYTHATQLLKLVGQPTVQRPEGTYTSDQELIWDNARQVVSGSNYRISVNPEALKSADILPKLKQP